jgi:hypothetical protein
MSGSQSAASGSDLTAFSTADRVESRLGPLEFTDGAPSDETAAKLYDQGAVPGVAAVAALHGVLVVAVVLAQLLPRKRGHPTRARTPPPSW